MEDTALRHALFAKGVITEADVKAHEDALNEERDKPREGELRQERDRERQEYF